MPCENFPDKEASIQCNSCNQWIHIGCTKLTIPQFNKLGRIKDSFFCVLCIGESLPFSRVAKIDSENNTISRRELQMINSIIPCSLCIECNDECDTCEKCCPDLYRVCNSCLTCDYCDAEKLNQIFSKRTADQFVFFHLNASSLTLTINFDDICKLINNFTNKPEIICVTETRIKQKTPMSKIMIPGYHKPVMNNSTSHAGGTCIYVNEEYCFEPREDLYFNISGEAEATFIEIKAATKSSKNIIVGCVYRHPHENHDLFFDKFSESIEKINKKYNVILMGDFNVDTLVPNDNHTLQYKNVLLSLGIRNTINKATRITPTSESSLDHISTNLNYSSIKCGVLESDVSDHFPIYAIANFKPTKLKTSTQYTRRFFSASKTTKFVETLAINLSNINFDDDIHPNIKMMNLVEVLQKTIDVVYPLITLSRKKSKELRKPWITPLIVKSTKKCKLLFKTFLEKKDPTSHNEYKRYRNELNRIVENAKDMNDNTEFDKVKNNIKKTWKLINKKTGRKEYQSNFPKVLKTDNGSIISNPKAIANHLNHHFVKKGVNLANKIPASNVSVDSFLPPRNRSTFQFGKLSNDQVLNIMKNLLIYKSYPDGIPPSALKSSALILAPILTNIYNSFVEIGEYPSLLKIARVTAILKNGDPTNVDIYRPISVLSQLNKIFEKLIHERMMAFIDKHNILSKTQFGFRKGHSTSHGISHLNEQIIENIEKQKVTAVLFMDLKSAFDTVDHNILLKKLEHYGFRDNFLDLIASYLTGRKQYV